MIDPRTLEIFYWVVELGSFRGAAEKLHTTQPAVSGRIAQLEQMVGARLLDRDRRRKVALTPKGVELLGFAQRVLALQSEMTAAMACTAGLRGTVRLGTSETIVHTWLSTLVRTVHERHPGLTLDISVDVSDRLRGQLVAGEIDLALSLGPVIAPRVENLALCSYRLVWIARAGLIEGVPDLARWPLITYSRETSPYRELSGLLHAAGLPARIFANSSLASIVRMVADGIGIGVIAEAVLTRELVSGEFEVLPGPVLSPLVFTASYAAVPGGSHAAAVCQIAQEVAAQP